MQAELLSVEDGRQLWGEQYEREIQQLVTVQNDISEEDGRGPVTICTTLELQGASWGENGTIVFGTGNSGLWRVSADGGTPERLTSVGSEQNTHIEPQLLPDGKSVLFNTMTSGNNRVALLSLETGEWRILFEGGTPRYLPTGYLVYAQSGSLVAVPFNIHTKKLVWVDRNGDDGRENIAGETWFIFRSERYFRVNERFRSLPDDLRPRGRCHCCQIGSVDHKI